MGRACGEPAQEVLARREVGPSPAALARELELTRSNVSNHLTCLRDCGIVVADPEGRKTRYEIVDAHLAQALNLLLDTTLAADENAPCIDSACDVPGCATGEGNR
ncbi:helix-turn-helix transcriptional regulator (plasmid) [Rothia amarae]|uniref:Helix-turn-helix transcriptional regulator n=1 Tax=Rothia amarae TaxID=169480 RepID=A0A7S7B024_9MICC|nr:helix-turn-helix domain-containing protein [Rothia amarae]QOW64944.1 helix-turn-helix transcriptional regulator [Rothia amarae]